jgi:hypothetical protein
VNHRAELAPRVFFLKMGAPVLRRQLQEFYMRRLNQSSLDLVTASPPEVAALVAPGEPIPILKMNCEGCEYAIYRSVSRHNPLFFDSVDQFIIAVHISRFWLHGKEELNEYGLLLALLFRAGFVLQRVQIGKCGKSRENDGVIPELLGSGYYDGRPPPCDNIRQTACSHHCEMFLFSRAPGARLELQPVIPPLGT